MAHKIKSNLIYLSVGLVILITLVCFFVYSFSFFRGFSGFFTSRGLEGREVFLQQTDFPELLKAGRELITKAEWKEYAGKYDGQKHRDLFIPEDVNIPEAISSLRKKLSGLGIIISIYNNGCLHIVFHGERETGHFGVRIYPEDFNEPESKYVNHEDIMIMPGMWYFDDAYDEFPKLREENKNLINKNKYLHKKE